MKQMIEIKIYTNSPYKIIKYIRDRNINIYNIIYHTNNIHILVEEKYYKTLSKVYNAEIIKHVGLSKYKDNKKSILEHIGILLFIIVLIMFYTRIILKVELTTVNNELRERLLLALEDKGIKKFSFLKSDKELFRIKEQILEENKDILEWLNIERVGMKYIINIEERINKNILEEKTFCHIVALKDGTISKIVSESGVEIVEVNDSVKKGDILISGEVKNNEELKGMVCAKGHVYAKTWYTIDISITKTYEVVNKLDKTRYNLLVKYNNKKHKIFNSRLQNYVEEDKKIIDIFDFKLYLQKEVEVEKGFALYTDIELEKKIDELIKEKMKVILKDNGRILERKVLKKVENDSTIDMSIFIVAEEQIGTTLIPE